MNIMHLATIIIAALIPIGVSAQAPSPDTFIRGQMSIRYATRTQLDGDKPKENAEDVYTVDVNVSNSARFAGTIAHRPYVSYTFSTQKGQMTYNLDLDVVNPANPAQRRNVGKMIGTVPVDESNVYRFTDSNLKVAVFPMGQAQGFESMFKGLALGKPPAPTGWRASLTKATTQAKQAISFTKTVNGQPQRIPVNNYDRMDFQNVVLGAGPVQIYEPATINGSMIFDYDKNAWLIEGVTVTYPSKGRLEQDKLSGTIRWNKASSQYEYDLRVDEPPPSESSIFSGPVDESAFFALDTNVTGLTGLMRYRDTVARGIVTDSSVSIDLKGNGLAKEQTMYLAKVVLFVLTVPLNAE